MAARLVPPLVYYCFNEFSLETRAYFDFEKLLQFLPYLLHALVKWYNTSWL